MHSELHLSKFLNDVCNFMHAKRRESLRAVLSSCLCGKSLGITALGRGIKRNVLEKHRIKQADRLLSNPHFQQELESIYRSISNTVLSGVSQPVIIVDWSNLDSNERHFLIRASAAAKGRSITIYEEVHTKRTKEKLVTHKKFLKNLSKVLPLNLKPIIVTDAGFKITWFKAVEKLGWNWVGRIRGRMKVKLEKKEKRTPKRISFIREFFFKQSIYLLSWSNAGCVSPHKDTRVYYDLSPK